ncbi:MAG: ECF transporter S component [Spirochaetaceae bacterium]|nr:MAG: ECF transporter S component [Spirochaetaceae bacterium]
MRENSVRPKRPPKDGEREQRFARRPVSGIVSRGERSQQRWGWRLRVPVLVLVCVAAGLVNALLNALIQHFDIPLFFDSVLTAVAAAVIGLPAGIAVGLLTNVWMEVLAGGTDGLVFLWFAPVNALTAVVVWAFVRTQRFHSAYDALLCTIAVTLVNAVAGTITVLSLFGGSIDYPVDLIVTAVTFTGVPVWLAAFLARIPLNLIDKSVTVAIAFIALRYLRRRSVETGPSPEPTASAR